VEESRVERFLFNSLLDKGLATADQLHSCVEDKRSTNKPFSGLLLEKGFATQSQLLLLLTEYKKEQESSAPEIAMEAEFGIAAVREGHRNRKAAASKAPRTSSPSFLQAAERSTSSRSEAFSTARAGRYCGVKVAKNNTTSKTTRPASSIRV